MTTEDIMARFSAGRAAVCRWAAKNGVGRKMIKGIAAYDWTEEDCLRFAERKRPGWEKGKPRK
jgi:hypothetical protein